MITWVVFNLFVDKNMHRVQEATELFAKVQNAYQVLADPQERAFYDRHRESILRKGKKKVEAGYSVDDLMAFFDPSVFKGFGDDAKGFYAIYRDLFAFLEDMEAEESPHPAKYEFTSFGSKNTPFEPSLKAFYDKFIHFSSIRSFYEADNYDDGYAENRRHRRAIDKENQKFREAMRREYNDTVRNLAAWVRKRDPRYQAYQKEKKAQRELSEARRKEEVARKRAEMAENYVAPDWAIDEQADDYDEFLLQQLERLEFEEFPSETNSKNESSNRLDDQEDVLDEDAEEDELDDDDYDDFYCVVCKKVFKNHKQWKNHEQSKKHRNNMLKAGFIEEESYDDEEDEDDDAEVEDNYQDCLDSDEGIQNEEDKNDNETIDDDEVIDDFKSDNLKKIIEQKPSEESGQKPPKKKIRQKKQSSPANENSTVSKKEKKKDKKSSTGNSDLKCSVCGNTFDSRNKLFRHIEESGHAALKTKKK